MCHVESAIKLSTTVTLQTNCDLKKCHLWYANICIAIGGGVWVNNVKRCKRTMGKFKLRNLQ